MPLAAPDSFRSSGGLPMLITCRAPWSGSPSRRRWSLQPALDQVYFQKPPMFYYALPYSRKFPRLVNIFFKEWKFDRTALIFYYIRAIKAFRLGGQQFQDNRKERKKKTLLSFCRLIGGAEPLSQNFPPLYDTVVVIMNLLLSFVLGQRMLSGILLKSKGHIIWLQV